MDKIRLRLDALSVDSFEVSSAASSPAGTVQAHAGTDASNCATCDTCQGPNCPGCKGGTAA